jgi:predicted DNA-binding transcriptional regulator AlpA
MLFVFDILDALKYYLAMYRTSQGFISTREVAKLLEISIQTLYNWLNQGKIPEPGRHPTTRRRQWTPEQVEAVRLSRTAVEP